MNANTEPAISANDSTRLLRTAYLGILASSSLGTVIGVVGYILLDTFFVYEYGQLAVSYSLIGITVALFVIELGLVVLAFVGRKQQAVWKQSHADYLVTLFRNSLISKIVVFGGVAALFFFINDSVPREGLSALLGTWALILGVASAAWMYGKVNSVLKLLELRENIRL